MDRHSFPWLPVGTEVRAGVRLVRVLGEGADYQILETSPGDRVALLVRQDAAWLRRGSEEDSQLEDAFQAKEFSPFEFGEDRFWVAVYPRSLRPIAVEEIPRVSGLQGGSWLLDLARALARLDEHSPNAEWPTALYFQAQHRCSATSFSEHSVDRRRLAVRLLTGGVDDADLSVEQIREINRWVSAAEIEEFLRLLGAAPASHRQAITRDPSEFALPGRPELEAFLRDHVIDLFVHAERYRAMGSKPPNGLLLVGAPGTGKSFAARKLAAFLSWPLIELSIGSVGSPYIHDTSVKLRQTFENAAQKAPCILLLDEIDALGADREGARQEHKVEEVGELLRQLETAGERGVLVVATSNRPNAVDPALRRRGRFDLMIELGPPTVAEVQAALEGLLRERPVEANISLTPVAELLKGRPMSDVAWVANEAGRLAVRAGKSAIDQACLLAAAEEIPMQPVPGQYI